MLSNKKFFIIFTLSIISLMSFSNLAKATITDSDQDGLSDALEIAFGTDLKNPDTDGDGFKDGDEVAYGYDPLSPDHKKLSVSQDVDGYKRPFWPVLYHDLAWDRSLTCFDFNS